MAMPGGVLIENSFSGAALVVRPRLRDRTPGGRLRHWGGGSPGEPCRWPAYATALGLGSLDEAHVFSLRVPERPV